MNPKPIQRRFYKTAAACEAAKERAKAKNPDCIIKAWQVRGLSPWSIETWAAMDYLRKMFPGATLPEIIEAIESNRDFLIIMGLDKKVAGIKGANSTANKVGKKNCQRTIAAYRKLQTVHPDAGKDWIQRYLAGEMQEKKAGKIINQGLRPRLCLRTIKTHTDDL